MPDAYFLCRHIHTAGHRCGSPALRDQPFCYFHHTTRARPKHLNVSADDSTFTMPLIEDRTGIQHALYEIMARVAAQNLNPDRARTLLYALQIASNNLPRHPRPLTADEQEEQAALHPLLADLEIDPTHGPLALIAPVPPPHVKPLTPDQQLLEKYRIRPTEPNPIPTLQATAESPSRLSPNTRVPHPHRSLTAVRVGSQTTDGPQQPMVPNLTRVAHPFQLYRKGWGIAPSPTALPSTTKKKKADRIGPPIHSIPRTRLSKSEPAP